MYYQAMLEQIGLYKNICTYRITANASINTHADVSTAVPGGGGGGGGGRGFGPP